MRRHKRVLIYSHDSFGLGHLRRCRAIAHALVEADRNLSVLILTGSPITGAFDFKARVDFVRVPGVIKLRNGAYQSLRLHMDIGETLHLRSEIIRHVAASFKPDMLLVDKEPLGLQGELLPTLESLRGHGVPMILGLRDVMDDPDLLDTEWERKNVLPALSEFYDGIWVYGLPQICRPLAEMELPDEVRSKIVYTGYLRRSLPEGIVPFQPRKIKPPYILVTTGGGGDGEKVMDCVLRMYEQGHGITHPALLVLGPFLDPDHQHELHARASRLDCVETLTFHAHMETLFAGAMGVVAMGGYNTFCEILSFDKPALLLPRTRPRREQSLRAQAAERLGLVKTLDLETLTPARLAGAVRLFPHQRLPSHAVVPGLLEGLENVIRLYRLTMTSTASPLRLATPESA